MLDVLLDVSRLNVGVIQPNYERFPLQPLLNRLYQDFFEMAQAKGLHLEVTARDDHVFSDHQLLERVLRNLLSNALRHTERGSISLTSRLVAGGVELTVRDTGSGIAAEHLPHIFEEYYQVGNQHRDRRKGMGMGLAIVKHLDQLLGYQLQVSSELGVGSCFSIVVPQRVQEPSTVTLLPA
jgi:signal transduction histidine kinase